MSLYEHVLIFKQDLSSSQLETEINAHKELIKELGGEVVYEESWGLRNLAYMIKDNKKAFYQFMNISMPSDANKKIEAKFGIGLIKRSLLLSEIDYSTIEEIKIPAVYGIGIRITPHGTLYNVKIGNAIKIKSHNKTFLVGTDEYTRIKNTLLELQSKE